MRYAFSEVRKTVIGVVGFAATLLATVLAVGPDLIPNQWLPWVVVAIAAATNLGIFQVPNQPAPGHRRRPGVSEVADPVGDIDPPAVAPDVATHYDPGP